MTAHLALALALIQAAAQLAPQQSDMSAWITPADYPPAALRAGAEGDVDYLLDVDVDGRVTECLVTRSSGHALLDEATCRLLRQRGRYRIERDEHSRPIPFRIGSRMEWRLPAAVAPAAPAGKREGAGSLRPPPLRTSPG